MIFCAFALGCMLELRAVLDFSDAMTFMIALPNILMLYPCAYGQARGESIHRRHALCSVGLIALADDTMQPACGREEIIDGFVLCAAVIPQHQTVRCPTEAAGELGQTGMPPEELQHFCRSAAAARRCES